MAAAEARGVDLSALRARRVDEDDFRTFHRILAMDDDNLRILERMRPADGIAKVERMMDHAPGASHREVPDPYYGGTDGFELMCNLLEAASDGLVQRLEQELG
jgi:protein-tyrosine phosphatase